MPNTSRSDGVHILSGSEGKIIFALLVGIGATLMYCVSEGQPHASFLPDSLLSAKLFILIPVLGVLAFTHAENHKRFYAATTLIMVVYGPLISYLLIIQSVQLLASAVGLFLFLLFLATWPSGNGGFFMAVLHTMAILWVVSSLVSVGMNLHFIPEYALATVLLRLGLNVGFISSYISVKNILGVILVAAILIDSIRLALKAGPPEVPKIPLPPKAAPPVVPDGLIGASLHPFLIAFDAFVLLAYYALALGWFTLAILAVYLFRTGKSVADYIQHLILHKRLWTGSIRISVLYGFAYALCIGIKAILPVLRRYATTASGFYAPYAGMKGDLLKLLVFASLVSLGILAEVFIVHSGESILWDDQVLRGAVDRQAFASATIATGYFCAAVLIYAGLHARIIVVSGFEDYGAVTLAITILIVVVSIAYLLSRVFRKQRID